MILAMTETPTPALISVTLQLVGIPADSVKSCSTWKDYRKLLKEYVSSSSDYESVDQLFGDSPENTHSEWVYQLHLCSSDIYDIDRAINTMKSLMNCDDVFALDKIISLSKLLNKPLPEVVINKIVEKGRLDLLLDMYKSDLLDLSILQQCVIDTQNIEIAIKLFLKAEFDLEHVKTIISAKSAFREAMTIAKFVNTPREYAWAWRVISEQDPKLCAEIAVSRPEYVDQARLLAVQSGNQEAALILFKNGIINQSDVESISLSTKNEELARIMIFEYGSSFELLGEIMGEMVADRRYQF